MIWFYILLICVSLDAFVMMMEKGATTADMTLKNTFKHTIQFSLVTTLMYMLGAFAAIIVLNEKFIKLNSFIGLVVFITIGIHLLSKAVGKKLFVERFDKKFNIKETRRLALICGIDISMIGVGMFFLNINVLVQLLSVFFITLLVVFTALLTGFYRGAAFQKWIYTLSAFVYLGIAAIHLALILKVM